MEQTFTCGCKTIHSVDPTSTNTSGWGNSFIIPCEGHRIKDASEGSG